MIPHILSGESGLEDPSGFICGGAEFGCPPGDTGPATAAGIASGFMEGKSKEETVPKIKTT
jgi:hypothetical protein